MVAELDRDHRYRITVDVELPTELDPYELGDVMTAMLADKQGSGNRVGVGMVDLTFNHGGASSALFPLLDDAADEVRRRNAVRATEELERAKRHDELIRQARQLFDSRGDA